MNVGTVKFYNSEKGFGFIENDETGEDVFVHFSSFKENYEFLVVGQKIAYDIKLDSKSGKKGATNVNIIK